MSEKNPNIGIGPIKIPPPPLILNFSLFTEIMPLKNIKSIPINKKIKPTRKKT